MAKRGFTLLEVLIVVIIIGILASIALPQYTATLEKSRSGEAVTNIGALRTAIDRYWYQNNSFPAAITNLDIDNPNSVTNRLFEYTIADTGTTATERIYTVRAERKGKESDYWVQWTQESNNKGGIIRSSKLGGPATLP